MKADRFLLSRMDTFRYRNQFQWLDYKMAPMDLSLLSKRSAIVVIFLISTMAFADVDLVKVIKSERKMYLLDGDRIVEEYHVALGANPKGHKQQEGDERTPEGYYMLDYVNENSAFYRSMHINYPNSADREDAIKRGVSPGGQIMVHGQVNRLGWLAWITQRFNWTNGCIALTNSEMDEFLELVKVGTQIQIEW